MTSITIEMEIALKTWILTFGMVLLVIGLILMSGSNIQQQSYKEQEIKREVEKWSISGNFTKGDNMTVAYRQGSDWHQPPFEPSTDYIPVNYKALYIEITDPNGNITEFEVILVLPYEESSLLTIFQINVTIDGGGLIFEENPKKIGGIVQYNGTYKIEIPSEWGIFPSQSPPSYLLLFKYVLVTKYPYTYLLPVGVPFGIVGLTISIWGIKSSKRKIRQDKKRSK